MGYCPNFIPANKIKRLAAALLALLMLAAAGCSDGKVSLDNGGKSVSSAEPTPTPTPEPEPEESYDPEMVDAAKYNIYVQMNNKIVDVMDTLYDYYEVVEYADEFALIPDSQYTYKYGISGYNTDLLDDAEFVAGLEPAFEPLDELTLEMLDDGKLLGYGFSHSITVVKRITAACYAQDISDYNIEELDLTPIRPLYQELLDTIEAYKAAAEDPNQLMTESMTADGAYHIGTQIDRMASALDWMIRQVESGQPIPDPGNEYLGGLIHVEEVLSDCIELYSTSYTS